MKFEIYCDESRSDLFTSKSSTEEYLLIGGLWLPSDKRESIKTSIDELKLKHKMQYEIKWKKVSPSKKAFFMDLIDLFMFFKDNLRFRCIAVKANDVNQIHYNANDPELGFYKFYYQLIHHWILDFNEYSIFCDIKTNRQKDRLKTLKRCLISSNLSSKIHNVQALPSHEVVLIQLTDFLLGIVSTKLNNSAHDNSIKKHIIEYLERKLNRTINKTSKSEHKFNVFIINLSGGW